VGNARVLFFALTVGFGQIVFAYNLFRTLRRRQRTLEEDSFVNNQQDREIEEKDLIHVGESSN
jgi:hypothetical protein